MKKQVRPSDGAEVSVSFETKPSHFRRSALWARICRYALILVAAYGINCLIENALRLDVGTGTKIWPPLLPLLLFELLYCEKKPFWKQKTFWVGLTLSVLTVWLLDLAVDMNPLRYLAVGTARLWNHAMSLIDSFGFVTLPPLGLGNELSDGVIFVFLSWLTVTVFFVSTRSKTRLLFPILYCLALSSPLFIYNMLSDSVGIALMVSSLLSLVLMRLAEKRAEGAVRADFVGITSLILSLLLFWGPVASVHDPWKEIPYVSETVEYFRQIVTNLVEGKPLFPIPGTGTVADPRTTVSSRRRFTGQRVMDVYADATSPLYLRSWIGGTYKGNAWYTPDLDDVPFAVRPDTPEEDASRLTENFFDLLAGVYGAEVYEKLGFLNTDITILPAANGQLVPLPVTTRSLVGSEGFGPVTRVSDGLYACLSLPNLSYSTWSIVPTNRGGESAYRLSEAIRGYLDFSSYCWTGEIPEGINDIGLKLCQTLNRDKMAEYMDFARDRDRHIEALYTDLTYLEGIEAVVRDLLETTSLSQYYEKSFLYREFVEANPEYYRYPGSICLPSAEADGYDLYLLDNDTKGTAGEAVARIVTAYLSEHYTYSVDPEASELYSESMNAFLLDSKEGYCVQFATAGTLILRRLGFAARYAEGYLADDFRRNGNRAYTQPYTARVRDNDAHAWSEVWVHGFGWIVAEMTPGYADALYREPPIPPETTESDTRTPETTDLPITEDPPATTPGNDTTEPPETDTETTIPDSTVTVKPPSTGTSETSGGMTIPGGRTPAPWLLALVILLPTVMIGMLLARRDRMLTAKRRKLLRRASDPASLSAEERYRLGEELTAALTAVLRAYRLMPKNGELPSAFAVRADEALASLDLTPLPSEAVGSLMAQIYGGSMNDEDLRIAARFLATLTANALKHLGFCRYVWYRFGRGIL